MSNNRNKIQRISTGSNSLDKLLLGGIETHAITEFYGPGGVGKTQLCHTLAVILTLDKRIEKTRKVLYMDTEAKFRPERLVSIAQARGFDSAVIANLLSNVLCVRAMTVCEQELILKSTIDSLLEKQKQITLLIVDSVINNYRAEFLGQGILSERQQKLYQFMHLLSRIAQNYGIAVVVTNQINNSCKNSILNGYRHTGGNIMTHTSTYRISLRRLANSNKIVARIVKSSYHIESETRFMLTEKGIENDVVED